MPLMGLSWRAQAPFRIDRLHIHQTHHKQASSAGCLTLYHSPEERQRGVFFGALTFLTFVTTFADRQPRPTANAGRPDAASMQCFTLLAAGSPMRRCGWLSTKRLTLGGPRRPQELCFFFAFEYDRHSSSSCWRAIPGRWPNCFWESSYSDLLRYSSATRLCWAQRDLPCFLPSCPR